MRLTHFIRWAWLAFGFYGRPLPHELRASHSECEQQRGPLFVGAHAGAFVVT